MNITNNFSFCNNCGKNGHAFHKCKNPITSVGIIVFRPSSNGLQYLLICRRNTLGFVDFIRGKYPIMDPGYIIGILNEMTEYEKTIIKTKPFDFLWNYLWGANTGIQYRGEEKKSEKKFYLLKNGFNNKNGFYNLENLLKKCTYNWNEPEWGFPKGRRNYQEADIKCAIREFQEETGYSKDSIKIIQNIVPIEEIFTGSNYKSYKHKYFIAFMNNNVQPEHEFQKNEVSNMEWKYYDEALNVIRDYNLEKKNVLVQVDKILKNYSVYV